MGTWCPSSTTRNRAAWPQGPSPPEVVNVSVDPSRDASFSTPGGVASVRPSPLLCRSCWYLGHSTDWQASPAACHTNRLPSRVASATSTLPSPSRSPTAGVITDQPPVNLGHPVGATPPRPYARMSYMADDCSTSARPSPSTSAIAGVLKNWRSFIWEGKPGSNVPVRAFQASTWSSAPNCCSGSTTSSSRRRPVAPMAIDIGDPSPPRCPKAGPPREATDGVSVAVGFLNSGASDAVVRYLPSGPLPYLLLPSAVSR